MSRVKRRKTDRDGNQFVLLPYIVLDSTAYLSRSFSTRALLFDLTRQFSGSNNGKLVLCDKAMKPRGWTSSATIHKAKRELLDAGLICQTRQGHKPNKASWYAVTWLSLDWSPDMDITRNGFTRSAYLNFEVRPPKTGVRELNIAPENELSSLATTSENDAIDAY